jgi:ubiquinone/menaquinone biosynthesis C-methylase UbiE
MSGNIDSPHINKRGEYVNLGIQWFLDHHRAKEQQRRGMVDDLNLKSGDIVLDLGCGPGLWTSLLAEKVKPDGRIVGLDSDTDFIRYASENLVKEQSEGIIEFHEGDFHSVPFEDESFDLVFFGNCFAYVTDHQKVLEEQKRVTRKGGRIAVKDFEGSVLW